MNKRTNSKRTKQDYMSYTYLAVFIFWVIFSCIKAFHSTYSLIIITLFYFEALLAYIAYRFSRTKNLLILSIMLGYSGSNILLTIFDQMGLSDFIILALYLTAFALNLSVVLEKLRKK